MGPGTVEKGRGSWWVAKVADRVRGQDGLNCFTLESWDTMQ